MQRSLTAVAVPVLVPVLLLVSGCASGSDRPSTEAISTALQSKDAGAAFGAQGALNKAAADCFAKAVHDSRFSDRGLRALLRGEKNVSSTDLSALSRILPKLRECQALITPAE